jgi:hypothetical protein
VAEDDIKKCFDYLGRRRRVGKIACSVAGKSNDRGRFCPRGPTTAPRPRAKYKSVKQKLARQIAQVFVSFQAAGVLSLLILGLVSVPLTFYAVSLAPMVNVGAGQGMDPVLRARWLGTWCGAIVVGTIGAMMLPLAITLYIALHEIELPQKFTESLQASAATLIFFTAIPMLAFMGRWHSGGVLERRSSVRTRGSSYCQW